jgi:hypothetical protein
MKIKMYTKSGDIDLLKSIDNRGGIFTAEEHVRFVRKMHSDKFASQESVLRWQVAQNPETLAALAFLIAHIRKEGFRNIVSFGSGTCWIEYLLKCLLPEEARVVATDFDSFFIEKAKSLFPDIIPMEFDFLKDDVSKISGNIDFDLDAAVFFSSAYVMDDAQFIHLFKSLKSMPVRQIIDFHGGYMDFGDVLYQSLAPFKRNPLIRRIFRKPLEGGYAGKFHGYLRDRKELRRLYKESGLDLVKETSTGNYKYIAICNC